MPLFQYRASDKTGRTRKGEILAATGRDARRILRESGLRPTKIAPSRGGRSRLNDVEIARFARQMATLLRAGFEIERALESLGRSDDDGKLRPILLGLLEEIRAGQNFSEALRRTRLVGEDVVLMIRAGEAAGALPEVLGGLADLYARRNTLVARIRAALLYPLIVLCLSVGVVIFLLAYVLPMMQELFTETKTVLPLPTRIVIGAATVFRWGAIPTLLSALGGFFYHRRHADDPAYRLRLERIRARIPIFGEIGTRAATVRFLRTFATLRNGGVALIEALSVAGAASGSARIEAAARSAQRHVAEGESLARALGEARLFPSVVIEAVSLGESSGTLPRVLGELADSWSEEVALRAETLAGALMPVLLIGIGAVVGLIALAVLLPVFQFESGLAK